jgi:hypothetical protein
MTPNLLTLPWQIQIALGGGYAAYTLAYVGLRKFHTASDVFFKTIVFSLFASAIFFLRLPVNWITESGIGVGAALTIGVLWNVMLRHWYIKILRVIGIHSNDLPTAWLSISHDQQHYFTQIAVILDDGSCLSCDDLAQFSNSPNGPAVFGTDGDLALYVTQIKKVSGDLSEQTSVIDNYHGDRMTYIPSNKIARITFRKKRNPKK